MSNINSYLRFKGNCREAMNFYQRCLGGELFFQTVGESPLAAQMPPAMKDNILHSTLTHKDFVIMGSDMVPQSGLVTGNAVSLSLSCDSEEAVRLAYTKLAEGGEATHPLENAFWGAIFGDLLDKYGNNWLLNYTKQQ